MRMLLPWICGFACLLVAQQACAQPPADREESSGRRAWVMATTMPEDVANPLPILSDERVHMVRMHMRMVSQAVPVGETGVVRAVEVTTESDGTSSYKDLAKCVIPEGVREALIVLVPTGEEGLKFNSKVVDLSKFKKGGCLYINLVNTKIGITIGDHKTVVKPGGMEFINPLEGGEKGEVLPIRFFYEIPKEAKAEWKLMASSKFAAFESRREICVFFYNKEIENVDFRGIPFITPKPRPKPRRQ